METRAVNPWKWQDQFAFAQGQEVTGGNRVLFCAGQTSVDPRGNPLHEGDMRGQIGQAFDNLETVLGEAGMDLSNVVRLNYYVTDLDAYFEAHEAVATRLGDARPAGTLLGVSRLAFPPLLVEIEATAVA
jgi:enamine deaminase RidA (YjgF/YER057c/UK114 family)